MRSSAASTCSPRRAPGIGKSLAYLIPALASGERVVVATATKALQEQLLTKDVPAAAAALGREVDVAVLKGRQNYLCRKSLHALALPLFRTAEDAAEYERLQDWIGDDRDRRPRRALLRAAPDASGPRSPSAPTAARAGAARSSRPASPSRPARGRRRPSS